MAKLNILHFTVGDSRQSCKHNSVKFHQTYLWQAELIYISLWDFIYHLLNLNKWWGLSGYRKIWITTYLVCPPMFRRRILGARFSSAYAIAQYTSDLYWQDKIMKNVPLYLKTGTGESRAFWSIETCVRILWRNTVPKHSLKIEQFIMASEICTRHYARIIRWPQLQLNLEGHLKLWKLRLK